MNNLPVEIILEIFTINNDIKDLINLSKINKKINEIYKKNIDYISRVFLKNHYSPFYINNINNYKQLFKLSYGNMDVLDFLILRYDWYINTGLVELRWLFRCVDKLDFIKVKGVLEFHKKKDKDIWATDILFELSIIVYNKNIYKLLVKHGFHLNRFLKNRLFYIQNGQDLFHFGKTPRIIIESDRSQIGFKCFS